MSTKADPDLDWVVVVAPILSRYWNFLCGQNDTEFIAVLLPLPARCCDYQCTTIVEILLVSLYFLIDTTTYPLTWVKTWNSTFQVLLTISSCIAHQSFSLSVHYFSTLLIFLVWAIKIYLPLSSLMQCIIMQAIEYTVFKFIVWRKQIGLWYAYLFLRHLQDKIYIVTSYLLGQIHIKDFLFLFVDTVSIPILSVVS